jgi:hypothetical protein
MVHAVKVSMCTASTSANDTVMAHRQAAHTYYRFAVTAIAYQTHPYKRVKKELFSGSSASFCAWGVWNVEVVSGSSFMCHQYHWMISGQPRYGFADKLTQLYESSS